MNVQSFLAHHNLTENPFGAEEARHDPVFERLIQEGVSHPDFAKILGQIDHPSTAVVFGEKGSGKTAIRLLIGKQVAQHNENNTDHRTLVVAYDDLNPVLDRVVEQLQHGLGSRRAGKVSTDQLLEGIRLEDHQDAILSLAVTQLVDGVLGEAAAPGGSVVIDPTVAKRFKKWPRPMRVDLLTLAALYDQPRSGPVGPRFAALQSKLRIGSLLPIPANRLFGTMAAIVAIGLIIACYLVSPPPFWLGPAAGLTAAAAVALLGMWGWQHIRLWWLCRKIHREVRPVNRSASDLRSMLVGLKPADLTNQPWPVAGDSSNGATNQDSRYQLTGRLLAVLQVVGYQGVLVLVDRVDEPTLVNGKPQRMRSVVWPMLDNKFLQQDNVGIKLLLPIELRHLVHRESENFYQEARLDKQNLIDRLTWSGATLYDLCNSRLRACRVDTPENLALVDLFDQDVSKDTLVGALDDMHQPRDAFKFLYCTVQEHCKMVPEDDASYRIPRATLESVRRLQSQRVQELYRGMAPA